MLRHRPVHAVGVGCVPRFDVVRVDSLPSLAYLAFIYRHRFVVPALGRRRQSVALENGASIDCAPDERRREAECGRHRQPIAGRAWTMRELSDRKSVG